MNSMILGVDDLSLANFFTTREERKLQLAACHVIYEQSDSHSVWYYFAARGVRKVTTGITGLWPRSVQSDAAF